MSGLNRRRLTLEVIHEALQQHLGVDQVMSLDRLNEETKIDHIMPDGIGNVELILTIEDLIDWTLPDQALTVGTLGDLMILANEGLELDDV